MNSLRLAGGVFEGTHGEFDGLKVLVVSDGSKVVGVGVESIVRELEPLTPELRAQIIKEHRYEWVNVDGVRMNIKMLSVGQMTIICIKAGRRNVSEKIERIVDSIQETGGYISPGAGPEAYIPANLVGDQTAQMLAAMMHNLSETKRTQAEVVRLQGDVSDVQSQLAIVQDTLAMRGSFMTVASWFAAHKVKPRSSEINSGGMRVAQICRDQGWKSNGIEMNGQFPAQKWPVEALRIWWEESGRQVCSALQGGAA